MKRKALWILGGIVGVFLAPLVLMWAVFVAEDVSRDLALRRYQPTSLADAVAHKYATPAMVARFIDQGADVHQTVAGANGVTAIPLIAEASARDNVEVAQLLLQRGARVGDANLWSRARNGNEAMARMLIEHGASLGGQPDYEESIGPELLQAAAFGGQAWLVRMIAQQGGDVQVVNAYGEGLLALALQSEYHDSLETTKALLAAGAHVNPLTSEGTPPCTGLRITESWKKWTCC